MIFVTIGNATQKFERLLEAVDRLAGAESLGPVMIQAGYSASFDARHCEVVDRLPPDEFARSIREAEVVISHGGAGTLWHSFRAGKVPVVMPRRAKYGEHVDDQYELVQALARQDKLIPAYEPEDLAEAVAEARRRGAQELPPPPTRMLELVAEAIEQLSRR